MDSLPPSASAGAPAPSAFAPSPDPLLRAAEPLLRVAMQAAEDPGAGYSVSPGGLDGHGELGALCRARIGAGNPDEIMMRDGEPYAERWYIRRGGAGGPDSGPNSGPNVYLHRFLVDDDPVLHDHPWASASWVLEGGIEETWAPHGAAPSRPARRLRPGDLVVRSAVHAHSLAVRGEARPVTMFATAGKTREWGFWPEGRFVHWRDFQRSRNGRA